MSLSDPGNISGALNFSTLANPTRAYYGGSNSGGVSQLVAGTNVTLSPAGGTGVVTINASGASGSVVGTDNEITATTASGTTTLSLASPNPAPTAGSYTNANITVDVLGRVTAAASGSSNIQTYIMPAPILLPTATGSAQILNTGTILTVGSSYRMNLRFAISIPAAAAVTGWGTGGFYSFSFDGASTIRPVQPTLYQGTNTLFSMGDVSGGELLNLGNATNTGLLSFNYSANITATDTSVQILCNLLNGTPGTLTGASYAVASAPGSTPAAVSFITFEEI